MELEPNPHRLVSLQSLTAERSGIWWVTVIAVGILIGNTLSFGTYELYQRWQINQLMVSVDGMLDNQQQRSMEQQKQIIQKNLVRQKVAEKKQAVDAQLQQTCIFWRQQVQQENTAKNRNYRDIACARVNGLSR